LIQHHAPITATKNTGQIISPSADADLLMRRGQTSPDRIGHARWAAFRSQRDRVAHQCRWPTRKQKKRWRSCDAEHQPRSGLINRQTIA
jgi:hypothetical protein